MTTVTHDPTPNRWHTCPFPRTGCTAAACIGPAQPRDPLAGITPSVNIPKDDGSLSMLLADAIKPSAPGTWFTEPATAADLRAAIEKARNAPQVWEPQPYVIHPRHYAQAQADGCMCVLGMYPCPWHTAVKVGDAVTWIDLPLGGIDAPWPRDGWRIVRRHRHPEPVGDRFDLSHDASCKGALGARRDQFRVADPSFD